MQQFVDTINKLISLTILPFFLFCDLLMLPKYPSMLQWMSSHISKIPICMLCFTLNLCLDASMIGGINNLPN